LWWRLGKPEAAEWVKSQGGGRWNGDRSACRPAARQAVAAAARVEKGEWEGDGVDGGDDTRRGMPDSLAL